MRFSNFYRTCRQCNQSARRTNRAFFTLSVILRFFLDKPPFFANEAFEGDATLFTLGERLTEMNALFGCHCISPFKLKVLYLITVKMLGRTEKTTLETFDIISLA